MCALIGASGVLRTSSSTVPRLDPTSLQSSPSSFDEGHVASTNTGSDLIFAGTVGGILCAFVIITGVAVLSKDEKPAQEA